MVVTLNDITADLRSNDGLIVTLSGEVGPTGEISVGDITATDDVAIEVLDARITGGIMEATYAIDGQEGVLTGSRDGENLGHDPVSDYDGTYEIALVRDDEEVANTVVTIRRGAFETLVVSEFGSWTLRGHATSDGTLVLTESLGGAVIAEASIDQDSYAIEGIYRAGDRVGRVYGKRSD